MDYVSEAKEVFDIEIAALQKMKDALDASFSEILERITTCKGKVIVMGMGKPGHIGTKIAATFASLGTPAFYMHPGEAIHGDLGMISQEDVVIIISYSGESDEVIAVLPGIKLMGATIIGITGNRESTLARYSDTIQMLPPFKEACHMGLAPTSSTTVELVYGDALAVVASKVYGFDEKDFGDRHPAGALGKKMALKVADLMSRDDNNAVIPETATLKDAVNELSKKGLGVVSIIDKSGSLKGIITDGDLRRQLEEGVNIYDLLATDVMTKTPHLIDKEQLAVTALMQMRDYNISCIPVVEDGKPIGTIRLQDVIREGILG